MKTRSWILLFSALLALFCAAAILLPRGTQGTVAGIYQDGTCIRRIDLNTVTEPYFFTVTDGDGHENLIAVEPGRIRVESANCPDQICVRSGWLSAGGKPIVCLPAKLSIVLEPGKHSEPEVDAVAG